MNLLDHPDLADRLAACGQQIAAIRSIYRWDGAVHDDPEARVALTLRTLGGLSTPEVYRTFDETVGGPAPLSAPLSAPPIPTGPPATGGPGWSPYPVSPQGAPYQMAPQYLGAAGAPTHPLATTSLALGIASLRSRTGVMTRRSAPMRAS